MTTTLSRKLAYLMFFTYSQMSLAGMVIIVECENGSYQQVVGGGISSVAKSYYCPTTDKVVTRWSKIESGKKIDLPPSSTAEECAVELEPLSENTCPGNRGRQLNRRRIANFD